MGGVLGLLWFQRRLALLLYLNTNDLIIDIVTINVYTFIYFNKIQCKCNETISA